MLRLLLDTNFIIDMFVDSRPQHKEAQQVALYADQGKADCYVLVSSLKDAYYLLCRHYRDEKSSRKLIQEMLDNFSIIDLTSSIALAALISDEPDYEDGLVRCAAESAGCDFIVSRDASAFSGSKVRRIDQIEALAIFESR